MRSVKCWALLLAALAACGGEKEERNTQPAEGALYAVGFNVPIPDGSSVGYLSTHESLDLGTLDATGATELSGNPVVVEGGGSLFIGNGETFSYARYDSENGTLVNKGTISFANEGMSFLFQAEVVSPTQAFLWSDAAFELIEWNPSTMTIVKRHDLSGLKRDDFGLEWRGTSGKMFRESDGLLFYYVAYTNDRATYSNAFHVVAFDTRTGTYSLLSDPRCGETAGFGGWVAENDDVYLFSDNFGSLAEILAGIRRPSCVLRIKAGERAIDPEYRVELNALLGGLQAWGLYYAGNGKAFTAGVDTSRQGEFNNAYNFLFADIHPFFRVDLEAQTASEVPSMAPAGVGWNPFSVDGKLYVPRTTGRFTQVGNWESSESAVYEMDGEAGTATERFRIPGNLSAVMRLR